MKNKICAILVMAVWAALALGAWFLPPKAFSDAERRPLAQLPELSGDAVLNGSFMSDFEDYSLDQFPLRDAFRGLKSLFHYYGLGQKDNNGIYLAGDVAAKQEYPLQEDSLSHALERFAHLYEKYLQDSGSKITVTVVPDKGYYLAEENSQLAMDYEALFAGIREGMPWAEFVDITGALSAEDYYRTDTHLQGAGSDVSQSGGLHPHHTGTALLWCVLRSGGIAHGRRYPEYSGKPAAQPVFGL